VLSAREIGALLAASDRDSFETTLFKTLLFSGLRSGEARGLEWQHVDLVAEKIRVRQQLQCDRIHPVKTPTSNRDVNLDPLLAGELLRYRNSAPADPSGFVFTFNGRPIRQQLLWWRVRRACERAGIAPSSVHDLRRTYGSILIAAGADVTYVQRQMGHASPHVTLRWYAGLWDEERNVNKVRAFLAERFA
jgi:integrase